MTSKFDAPSYDVVVVGGSQAGLAVGYHLKQRGLRFVILDAAPEIGHVWSSRWDSLTLFTPAQYSGLPGMDFPAEKDSYASRDEVAAYLKAYASAFDLPVKGNARVTSVSKSDGGYLIAAADEVFQAGRVVVATGPFQVPFVPPIASGLDEAVTQIHSADYRSPAQLPEGRVLVVGGGNSGFQIAEELAATRKVDLAVGKKIMSLPQRFLGRDLFWWLSLTRSIQLNVESRVGRRVAQRDTLIGSSERRLRRSGVTIRKRLVEAAGRHTIFEDGSGLDVDVVIWATGYRPVYSWIDIPEAKDESGH